MYDFKFLTGFSIHHSQRWLNLSTPSQRALHGGDLEEYEHPVHLRPNSNPPGRRLVKIPRLVKRHWTSNRALKNNILGKTDAKFWWSRWNCACPVSTIAAELPNHPPPTFSVRPWLAACLGVRHNRLIVRSFLLSVSAVGHIWSFSRRFYAKWLRQQSRHSIKIAAATTKMWT